MRIAILSIGTELTRGELVNTNAAWIAAELIGMGFEVGDHLTVEDTHSRVVSAIHILAQSHDALVSTGGLGPTSDDLTAEAFAEAAAVPLERHDHIVENIRAKFALFGRVMPESNAKQADVPQGAQILDNLIGTAPGFEVRVSGCRCFVTPGVPREMKQMFRAGIVPRIEAAPRAATFQTHVRTFGLTESGLAETVDPLHQRFPGLTLGYRAHFPEIEVKAHVTADSIDQARAVALEAREAIVDLLGSAVYGGREDRFAAAVGRALREANLTLAVAESCTGGRIGAMLTADPGSSAFLKLDAVTYSNEAKQAVLGVDAELLRDHGAVSEPAAIAMAEGALRVGGSDIAVAVTGIAGPDGGTADKPVGTVWFALARRGGPTVAVQRRLPGDRDRVQTLAAYIALELLRRSALGIELNSLR